MQNDTGEKVKTMLYSLNVCVFIDFTISRGKDFQMNRFNRVLLKLSGEALKGDLAFGYQPEAITDIVERISGIVKNGVEVAIVVGAGNLWRGGAAGDTMDRVDADKMGMLATAMNAITIKNYCNAIGIPVLLQCAIPTGGFLPVYDREKAVKALESGQLVVFAGGTGNRQPVFHHRHRQRPARTGNRMRCRAESDQSRRGILRRPEKISRCGAVR